MKKIYILTNSYPEKYETFNSQEMEFALKNFDNIKILSFSKTKNHIQNVIYLNISQGILEFLFPKNKSRQKYLKSLKYVFDKNPKEFLRNLYSYFMALSILRNVKLEKSELIFSYWLSRATIIAYYINILNGNNFICQGHGSDIYIYPPQKKILEKAKFILTVSEKNRKFLIKKYSLIPEKVKVFRLGVSINFYNKLENQKKTKKNSNIKQFLSISGYTPVKGIDILLKAIYNLVYKKNIKNVRFKIFGKGKHYRKYLKSIKKYKLEKFVELNPWLTRNKIPRELLNADCFILPSRSEGLPVALMEACAASLPIIATDVGGVSEIAVDNYNAILVKNLTPESLSIAIETFLNLNQNKINKMKKKSKELYLKHYILEKNLEEKYKFLQEFV
ncbi:hypothetical protein BG95_04920 [Thermosipho sp. 1063]|uniref:glycosyltransferase family 4 protein n=1 Tax=unclassified Thermosipho (in: thermotogales) TaxID=2676525 RepID=UPI0009494972|nr:MULTISPECIES: glycosyltransferase family 4 protein [unclassified Thermosipho (in: thermotogales)]ANQ54634.1 hypothetical protein Y592_04990 [Thermosipho sp. 1070]APT73047.1 hypothetical protein BG95_04920 [Thermosipho sp. 1063]OOC43470.1 hypothetical protein XO08_04810 [Thermosipho sp. 1074]